MPPRPKPLRPRPEPHPAARPTAQEPPPAHPFIPNNVNQQPAPPSPLQDHSPGDPPPREDAYMAPPPYRQVTLFRSTPKGRLQRRSQQSRRPPVTQLPLTAGPARVTPPASAGIGASSALPPCRRPVRRRVGGRQIAPALKRPPRPPDGRDQLRCDLDQAIGAALLVTLAAETR